MQPPGGAHEAPSANGAEGTLAASWRTGAGRYSERRGSTCDGSETIAARSAPGCTAACTPTHTAASQQPMKLEVGRMAIAKASRDVWRDFQRREGKNLDERMPTLTEDVVPGLIEKVEEDVQPAEEEDEEDEEESDSEGEEENFKI